MEVRELKDNDKQSGVCRLSVAGEMTIYAAEQMLQMFSPYWRDYKQFALELAKVSEIDTTGIQLLLQFQRSAKLTGHSVQILSCSQVVRDLFALYSLNESFDMSHIQATD